MRNVHTLLDQKTWKVTVSEPETWDDRVRTPVTEMIVDDALDVAIAYAFGGRLSESLECIMSQRSPKVIEVVKAAMENNAKRVKTARKSGTTAEHAALLKLHGMLAAWVSWAELYPTAVWNATRVQAYYRAG